mgnify:CR=1 FL=1
MEFKDYYKILGIKANAEAKEIKTAYRKLARKYHPDMNPDKGAEEKFKEVAEAYQVLKDTQSRAEFDELRKYGSRSGQSYQPPPEWQRSGGFRQQAGTHSATLIFLIQCLVAGAKVLVERIICGKNIQEVRMSN